MPASRKKKTSHVRTPRERIMFSSKFIEDLSLEELRARRDMAKNDGDIELAFACATAIDKKRGLYK